MASSAVFLTEAFYGEAFNNADISDAQQAEVVAIDEPAPVIAVAENADLVITVVEDAGPVITVVEDAGPVIAAAE